jgi:ribosomal protein S18 acetylase RimI-like enzyme
MEIRAFRATDEAEVIALWHCCGLTRPWNDPHKDIARKAAVQPEMFLVGVVEAQVVATVMAGYDGHRGWINYLAVSPEYQAHGHGRRMMDAAEACLRERGCPKISLQIRRSNMKAAAFYAALGYAEDEVISMGKRLEHDDTPQRPNTRDRSRGR